MRATPTRPERSSDHDMPVAYFRFPPPSADVRLAMTADTSSVAAGSQVTYTITAINDGSAPAENVTIANRLPPNTIFVSCNATGGGACGGGADRPTATFPLLAPGASEMVTIVAALSCAVPDAATLDNVATVSAETADPDEGNNSAEASIAASNAPPATTGASASPTTLLLPLHQMVRVTIDYTAVDSCGAVTTTIGVRSDEPVTAPVRQQGLAGLTSPDWQVLDPHHALLRAERSVRGNGRVYTIRLEATDAAGGTSSQELIVTVPRHIAGPTHDR
jgi:uncharacterized repeat protein (TIGR01451 family)